MHVQEWQVSNIWDWDSLSNSLFSNVFHHVLDKNRSLSHFLLYPPRLLATTISKVEIGVA